jgi:hypothetical protein
MSDNPITETNTDSDDYQLEYYKVTLTIATMCGDPDQWDWEELIGDTVLEVNSVKMQLTLMPSEDEEETK